MTAPAFLPYYILAGSVAIILALLFGLRRSLIEARWSESDRTRAVRISAVVLVAWFALAIGLSWFGIYRGVADRMPTIQYGLLVPIVIGVLLLWRSSRFARLIDAVPQQWLVGVQLYRALGAIFLILYASGELPGLFAWPAGVGDMLVGILAPIVALAYVHAPRENASLVRAWNLFGIADLIIAVGTGTLTSPSPLQRFAFDAPNELISRFPLALIPTFLVPISIVLHVASLKKLRQEMARMR
jgi:hypothetical protein